MTIEQISIFIENRKNALAEFTNVLATHNINMRAMSLADTSDFGIARIMMLLRCGELWNALITS